ncbi:MAG: xanthine dehydrogenase family protein molybdopterin-binding subunit [Chloroflexota bacterium]
MATQEAVATRTEYRVIGTRPIRHDGLEKVTGLAKYGGDYYFPNMLHGKILRSPHAHARIVSIDTSKAEALDGVRAVVTSNDLAEAADKIQHMGEGAANLRNISNNVLAGDKVFYHGHPVAAVAAMNPHVAEEALKLIEVEYEVLPHVLDVKESMAEDAPILHDNLRTDAFGKQGEKPTNIGRHFQHQRGDLEKGFAEADVIVERELKTAMVHQGYIEPQASTVHYKANGHVEVWTATQGAFQIREQLANLLQIPISLVKVTPTEIGGGFGGKFTVYTDLPAALLSRKAGHRPVRIALGRADVLKATGPTSGSYVSVKMGVTKDGVITAAETTLIYESGAYPGSPVGAGAGVIFGPYRLENVKIDGFDVVVNKPKTSAYRAPGGTNAAFASEVVIDELAEKLGIDPLEMRRINGAVEGDRRPDGPIHQNIGFVETVEEAMSNPHYSAPLDKDPVNGKKRGRGVASGFWFNGGGRSSMSASVNPDGTISLTEGSTDIGGSRASIAMQLAETVGIAAEDVNPQVVDTDSVGYNDGTGGSRVTFATGIAAYEVGLQFRAEICKRLAEYWEVDKVTYENGLFSTNGDNEPQSIGFKEAAKAVGSGEPIAASANVQPKGVGAGFGTHTVDVEVDMETGKVEILRYTANQDVGRAIHPSYVEGQIQGGVVQGIGWALNEEYFYDENGQLRNASLLDYRMPTSLDLPMIDAVLIEKENPGHPYGVRGVGEVPIVPPPAAIANAIYDAIGIRMEELPMSPPKVMAAIWANS